MKINLKEINDSFGPNKIVIKEAPLNYELDLEGLHTALNFLSSGMFEANNRQTMGEIVRLYLEKKALGIEERETAKFVCYETNPSKPTLIEFLAKAKHGVVMDKSKLVHHIKAMQSGQQKLR